MSLISYVIARGMRRLLLHPAILNSKIDETASVCSGSQFYYSTLGRYSYIGNECKAINSDIGSFCSIADSCYIGGMQHEMQSVSTSPVFHSGRNVLHTNFANTLPLSPKRITIGNDVWIGANCLIKSGVTIGDGAVVGMGSIVTKDVEPYSIVAGNPAKVIRKRFDDDTIHRLLMIKWWNWKDCDLKAKAEHFNCMKDFFSAVGNI